MKTNILSIKPSRPLFLSLPLLLTVSPLALASDYEISVLKDSPLAYYRLGEATDPLPRTAVNSGSLGAAGNGTHFPGMRHQVPGALAGSSDTAARYSAIDSSSTDGGVPTIIPYNPALNPAGPFTVEAWLRPTIEGNGNAQCPLRNRLDTSGNRNGWDFFQRASSTGWNWRIFNGNGSGRIFDLTGGAYTVGQWCHLVAVYNVTSAQLYLNGVQVASSSSPSGAYSPNPSGPMTIGGYDNATENPFVGDVDEMAFYGSALSPAQILAHYQNGINPSRSTPYETLITTDNPLEYLRLNDPARSVATNLGTLGPAVNTTYVNTSNGLSGPQTAALAGFEAGNTAVNFTGGSTGYVELGNPPGLNFAGAITLEAWVQPAASQFQFDGNIIAHGYSTDTVKEVSLRIEGGSYQIVSHDGSNHLASFAVPVEDQGAGNWVHLVGTYDGANWNLYRNGDVVATSSDATGALKVDNANWAIGSRGRWKNASGFPSGGQERVFTGGIDEAAIYNQALSPERIAAHYSQGKNGASPLAVTDASGNLTLTWSAGALQEADEPEGPYTDVVGATSPYHPTITTKKFYRLRF